MATPNPSETNIQKPQIINDPTRVEINGKAYKLPVITPPNGVSLSELEQALKHNRQLLKNCQQRLIDTYKIELTTPAKAAPLLKPDYDSPTQEALMAHQNIQLLIPMINIRGGTANYSQVETLETGQRVILMHKTAKALTLKDQAIHPPQNDNSMAAVLIFLVLLITLILILTL